MKPKYLAILTLPRDRRAPATVDGGGNTYRSHGNVCCVTDAGAVHAG